MEKIWFFVEGDSEENFITNLLRKKYSGRINREKDLSNFVDSDIQQLNFNLAYCENCHNVEKIPHRINDLLHMIEKTNTNHVFIICDLEKFPCYTERKCKFEEKIEESIDKNILHYAISNPMIEAGYWECEKLIERIIQIEHKSIFKVELNGTISLLRSNNPLDSLKKSFKKYNVKYREAKFSEMFFPRVDYDGCPNNMLNRVTDILDII